MALVLDGKELKIGECSKLLVELKVIDGQQFVDVRKWVLFPGAVEFMPSKKGVCLKLSQWSQVIEKIKELLTQT